jgi:hypothetical protein
MNMAGYRGQLKTCAGRRERFRRVYGPLGVCQKLENFKTREKRDEFVMGATRQIQPPTPNFPQDVRTIRAKFGRFRT